MDYNLQIQMLLPDRVLYIWESEKKDSNRRKPLLRAAQVSDQIETLLENMESMDSKGNFNFPEDAE